MQNPNIQGILWKWTNYWNGWQPRWFVLDKSMLSYYKSQEDVSLGCKGSVSIAAAVVTAHKMDPYRLDVVVPGEQHFYLKAGSPHERQNWLVALGSVKSSINSEKAYKVLDELGRLTQKQCEVRLYCDSLMQQIHSVRCLISQKAVLDVQVAKLGECSCLIGETCDAFIKALEECVQLSVPSSPLNITSLTTTTRSASSPPSQRDGAIVETSHNKRITRKIDGKIQRLDIADISPKLQDQHCLKALDTNLEDEISTVFSRLIIANSHHQLALKDSLKTAVFVKLCENIINIFDLLHPTAFIPVKLELCSHISTLFRKYEVFVEASKSDGTSYKNANTLEQLLSEELQSKQAQNDPNSLGMALLRLNRGSLASMINVAQTNELLADCILRGLDFIREFLQLVLDNLLTCDSSFVQYVPDLGEMLNASYKKTLRQHHQWIARGVFTIAIIFQLAVKESVPFLTFYESLFIKTDDRQIFDEKRCCERVCKDLTALLDQLKNVSTSLNHQLARLDVFEED